MKSDHKKLWKQQKSKVQISSFYGVLKSYKKFWWKLWLLSSLKTMGYTVTYPKAPRLKKINRDWKNQSEIDFLPKSIENSIWEGFWKSIEKSIFFCLFNFKTWIQNSTENSTENSIEKPIWDNWFCCLRCCMCCNFE